MSPSVTFDSSSVADRVRELKDKIRRLLPWQSATNNVEEFEDEEEWLKPIEPPAFLKIKSPTKRRSLRSFLTRQNHQENNVDNDANQKRTVHFNSLKASNDTKKKAANRVTTTKYTLWTFLPKNLFLEQFRRVANVYFVAMIILQTIPALKMFNAGLSAIPLIFILTVTAIKDGVEDWRRHQSDTAVNQSPAAKYTTTSDGETEESKVQWQHLQPGDLVVLKCDECAPADMVLLHSTHPAGLAYIQTRSLDGETNLKVRQALPITQQQEQDGAPFKGSVEVDAKPSPDLYVFKGGLQVDGKGVEHLGINQLLPRNCFLRNTQRVVGVVVYTGNECKACLNGMGDTMPSRRSLTERRTNPHIIVNFTVLLAASFLCALINGFRSIGHSGNASRLDGLPANGQDSAYAAFVTFWSCLILFQTIVPISLYITVEVCKSFHAYFIHADTAMLITSQNDRGEEVEERCLPRTWNISDDLGQVGHVFADKTGTLTRNEMRLVRMSISGNIKEAVLKDECSNEQPGPLPRSNIDIQNEHFWWALGTCHTVIQDDVTGAWASQSPDETALLEGAKREGYAFQGRPEHNIITFADAAFRLLAVIDFDGERRRMSVVVQKINGQCSGKDDTVFNAQINGKEDAVFNGQIDREEDTVYVYCKGADSVLMPRLRAGQEDLQVLTGQHLQAFAQEGLRTLVVVGRQLKFRDFASWNDRYNEARVANEQVPVELLDELEGEFELLGATAIEDRLQAGVPQALKALHAAHIRTWLLTGDKAETALNVAHAAGLFRAAPTTTDSDSHSQPHASLPMICSGKEDVARQLLQTVKIARSVQEQRDQEEETRDHGSIQNVAFLIDGDALKVALEHHHRLLARAFSLSSTVICCRTSPAQKAAVVTLVKHFLHEFSRQDAGKASSNPLTLAIGDGANDVAMLQAADLGVGIRGKEGMQAVMAADYAVSRFRFLPRLLFWHGRLSHSRTARASLGTLYKNAAFVGVQAVFQWSCAFTAQYAFDWTYMMFFNALLTVLPVLALGILDDDIKSTPITNADSSAAKKERFKKFLGAGKVQWPSQDYSVKSFYTNGRFAVAMCEAVWQAAVCYALAAWILGPLAGTSYRSDGGSLLVAGNAMALGIILAINGTTAWQQSKWTWPAVAAHVLSLILLAAVLSVVMAVMGPTGTLWGTWAMAASPLFWLSLALILALTWMPRVMISSWQRLKLLSEKIALEDQSRAIPELAATVAEETASIPESTKTNATLPSVGFRVKHLRSHSSIVSKDALFNSTSSDAEDDESEDELKKVKRRHSLPPPRYPMRILHLRTMQQSPVAGYAFATEDRPYSNLQGPVQNFSSQGPSAPPSPKPK